MFVVVVALNPGFLVRLAPGEGLLDFGSSMLARSAEQDELCDEITQRIKHPLSAYSSKPACLH